ncbi:hypothetical protein ES703_78194 [subsurface metagenome]
MTQYIYSAGKVDVSRIPRHHSLSRFKFSGLNLANPHPGQLCPQHLLHMLQGKVVCPVIKGGNAVNRHLHLITTNPGISHCVQYTDMSTHPANNQLLWLEPEQLLLKRGTKKGAIGRFGYYFALIPG